MKAIVSVIGKDSVGILSSVSGACAECNASIIEVTQSVVQDMFAMIMVVNIANLNCEFSQMQTKLDQLGKSRNLSIHTMHEDIFNSMHRI